MTIGEHIMVLRRQKNISQNQLGAMIGTSGDILGRYERGIMVPSINVIIKISKALSVSIDYLVGISKIKIDKNLKKRLEIINSLPEEEKNHILKVLDALIKNSQLEYLN